MLIPEQTQSRLRDLIREYEQQSQAELVTVIAEQSGDYRYYALLFSIIFAWLMGAMAALASFSIMSILILLPVLVLLGYTFWLLNPRWLCLLIPKVVRERQVRARAYQAFIELGVNETSERLGVLLFVSEYERQVEVMADIGLNEIINDAQWQVEVNRFTQCIKAGQTAEGFECIICGIGDLLIEHRPAIKTRPANELPDHLFVL